MDLRSIVAIPVGRSLVITLAIGISAAWTCCVTTGQEIPKSDDPPGESTKPEIEKVVTAQPEIQTRRVKRAARPEFTIDQANEPFFDDVFADALVGDRPKATGNSTGPAIVAAGGSSTTVEGTDSTTSASAWSEIVPASVLEDEIKRQQIRLNGLVTNPGQFKTRNGEIRETFQMLAVTFAIVGQYDERVRWKDQSIAVTAALIESAKQARGTDLAAFENAQRTTQRLGDLVRGGSFGDEVNAAAVEDWSSVVDRTALMNRLEDIVTGPLKSATSSKVEFSAETESILHEAAIVAAIGRVLQLPEMDDADDEDYGGLATEMIDAARVLSSAAIANDFEAAVGGLNKVSQSCVRCHADWR